MFCQVIKSNDKKCHNYSRKNKECCWSHRNLENNEIVVIKPKKEQAKTTTIKKVIKKPAAKKTQKNIFGKLFDSIL